MADIKYKIVKPLGILNVRNGWKKEANLVSWNDGDPKVDIRDWNDEHTSMGRGITLTLKEAKELLGVLENINFEE